MRGDMARCGAMQRRSLAGASAVRGAGARGRCARSACVRAVKKKSRNIAGTTVWSVPHARRRMPRARMTRTGARVQRRFWPPRLHRGQQGAAVLRCCCRAGACVPPTRGPSTRASRPAPVDPRPVDPRPVDSRPSTRTRRLAPVDSRPSTRVRHAGRLAPGTPVDLPQIIGAPVRIASRPCSSVASAPTHAWPSNAAGAPAATPTCCHRQRKW